MARHTRCRTCDHPERKAIEIAMAVSSVRDIAETLRSQQELR